MLSSSGCGQQELFQGWLSDWNCFLLSPVSHLGGSLLDASISSPEELGLSSWVIQHLHSRCLPGYEPCSTHPHSCPDEFHIIGSQGLGTSLNNWPVRSCWPILSYMVIQSLCGWLGWVVTSEWVTYTSTNSPRTQGYSSFPSHWHIWSRVGLKLIWLLVLLIQF